MEQGQPNNQNHPPPHKNLTQQPLLRGMDEFLAGHVSVRQAEDLGDYENQ